MLTLEESVAIGLGRNPKQIPCSFLYDERGAALFEAITETPAYYLTRLELGLLEQHGASIARRIGPDVDLIELGSGAGRKTRVLLSALGDVGLYVPVDISREQLEQTVLGLRRDFPRLAIQPVTADFTLEFTVPERRPETRAVVFFPGSTLGNFEPADTVALLARLRTLVEPRGGMLIGIDLKKDPRVLHFAYNDPGGTTRAFNKNVLVRLNRELGWNFCLEQFEHYAPYDPRTGRITMTLVSTTRQSAHNGVFAVDFDEGEPIVTEYSYKYTLAGFESLAAAAGLALAEVWQDPRRYFALCYLAVA